jgi:hypothetical protein
MQPGSHENTKNALHVHSKGCFLRGFVSSWQKM